MYRYRIAVIAAVAAVSALPGCGSHQPARSAEPEGATPVTSSTVVAEPLPLAMPAPEVLTDVLYRLSDPAVLGAEKVNLVEGAKPTDADTIDKFATALADGGYLPLNLDAAGLSWSDRHPGCVSADVTVNTAHPDAGGFTFPMEFKPRDGGWQLSQETAKTLLAFGKAHAGSTTPAPAP